MPGRRLLAICGVIIVVSVDLCVAAPEPRKQEKADSKVDTSKLVPLTDLGTGKYQGFSGGLYPDGKNERPSDHEAAALALAQQVQPLDADGKPTKDGKIVLLGVGFSNTVQVFQGFMAAAREDKDLNPNVVFVNAARWAGCRRT